MKLLLVGQPNSGKSTIFNAVAGYRSATANFPGTSVSMTMSRALVLGREVEVLDLPGIYGVGSPDAGESDTLQLLLDGDDDVGYDVIVNVIDASRLGRSLELSLQLMELRRPMVIALNMMDEALRKGIDIDPEALAERLGVPVVPTIATRGRQLRQLFRTALRQALSGEQPTHLCYDLEVESAIRSVSDLLAREGVGSHVPHRLLAVKLLEGDGTLMHRVLKAAPAVGPHLEGIINELETAHGWCVDQVVTGSRHAVAHAIEDAVTRSHTTRTGWRERLDMLLLHPLSGGPIMLAILGLLFFMVFDMGRLVEAPLVALFDGLSVRVVRDLVPGSLGATLARGIVMGLSGGFAIVLPYLIPFLLGLAILEDTGYLPRMAYILDNFMHRLGLHGKSVLPLIIGYGCSVPAMMATRILESKRDRWLTTALAAFIPCSARTIVIYGLVAAYLGPLWAIAIYLINILVVVALGNLFARLSRGRSPGLILEIPDLRLPSPRTLMAKTWLSLKEFVTVAWPVLIISSAVLAILEWAGAGRMVNVLLSPLTVGVLGLPIETGMTLVFGILRKELTLVMLVQALGTADVGAVMSTTQLVVFTLFVVFYVPCLATIAAMSQEVGWRDTLLITGLTVAVATGVAGGGRLLMILLG